MMNNNKHYVLDDGSDQAVPNPYLPIPISTFFNDPPKCCIFGPKFCLNIPQTFQIREKIRMNHDSCFKVYDADSEEIFKISNPSMTLRGKHVLSHVNGEELVKMKKKLLSLHPTWHLNSGPKLETRLATLVFEFTLLKKKGHVYVYNQPYPHEDDDTKYDHLRPKLLLKSDSSGRDCKVFDEVTNEVFAEISKRCHGNTEMLMEKENYTITVFPGVDVLFMVTLALMYEYAMSDIEK